MTQRCCLCRRTGHFYAACPNRKVGTKPCSTCAGLAHRRHPFGCLGCFKPYAAEQFVAAQTQHQSSIAEFGAW